MQQRRLFKKQELMKNLVKTSSAEVILLISFCYYMIVGVVTTSSYAAYVEDIVVIQGAQMQYFICEHRGHNISNPCNRSDLENVSGIFIAVGYFLLILYPFAHLMYVLNIKCLRQKCKSCCCHTPKESVTSSKSKTKL